MTDKDKKNKIADILLDFYDEYRTNEINRPLISSIYASEILDTLQEETVSEDLEKIVEEIAEPTILNAYGTKELARRLRNTICGTSVSEDLDIAIGEYCSNPDNFITYIDVAFAYRSEQKDDIPLIIKAIKFGAQWKEQQMMAKAVEGDITKEYDYGKTETILQEREWQV